MRPGDRIGAYAVVRRVAAGGSGVVYEGRDGNDNPVAIKVLSSSSERAVARFEREAELLASFEHDHIVRYFDHGVTDDGLRYLIEEWVEGEVLSDVLAGEGLTLAASVTLARQVASALAAAHERGVVHRDIKPGNIVRRGDDWLVLDFGIARVLADRQRLTRTGVLLGTVGYMSPEQARGEKEISPAADVFGLGCVLYEAITAQPAFAGLNPLSIRTKILVSDPPDVGAYQPAAPGDLRELTMEMLAKEPGDRPGDAQAVLDRLELLSPVPESAPRPRERFEDSTVEMPITPSGRTESSSLVLSSALVHLAGDDLETWRLRLRDAVSHLRGKPWVLEDGSLVFAPTAGDQGPVVAARAALAAHAEFPQLSLSVTTTSRSNPTSDSIERAAAELKRDTVHNIFADFEPDRGGDQTHITIDATTASLLPDSFEVRNVGGRLVLGSEQPKPAAAGKDDG